MKSFKEYYICEAFLLPPRNFLLFLKNTKKKLEEWQKSVQPLLDEYKKYKDDEEFEDAIDRVFREIDYRDVEDLVKWASLKKSTHGDLITKYNDDYDWFVRMWEAEEKTAQYWTSCINSIIHTFRAEVKGEYGAAINFKNFDDLVNRLDERRKNIEGSFEDEAEYRGYPKEQITFVLNLIEKLQELKSIIFDIYKKLYAYENRPRREEDEPFREPKEDVEIMYHASVSATQLKEKGFQKEFKKEASMGLGGSNSIKRGKEYHDNAISFTYDLYIAKEIARCLKETVMIAKGEVKWTDIREWSEKEKIWDKVWDYAKSSHGWMTPDEFKSPEYQERVARIKKHNETHPKSQMTYHEPPEWTPYNVFLIYRYYLTFTKKRYDPLFFGTDEKFINFMTTVNYSDVGVIEAKVDLSGDKVEGAHMIGEKEIRVLPEQVLEITRIIK